MVEDCPSADFYGSPPVSAAPRGQSRMGSLIESLANVFVGFGIATLANVLLLPLFGLYPSAADALGIGAVMTAVSIARSYALRRVFERRARGRTAPR